MSQLKVFTDAPLNFYSEQPLVWMFRGCIPVFTISLPPSCVFSSLSSSWLPILVPLASCNFKGDFHGLPAFSVPHSGSGCVFLLLFPIQSPHSAPHTNFTESRIKTCTMALRVSFSGAECCCYQGTILSAGKLTRFEAC